MQQSTRNKRVVAALSRQVINDQEDGRRRPAVRLGRAQARKELTYRLCALCTILCVGGGILAYTNFS